MDFYRLSVVGVNISEGTNRFGGIASLYEKYLVKFSSDDNFKNMCDAMNKKDAQAAFSYAHALKGLAGNLSLNSLYDSIYPLVEELRQGNIDSASKLLPPVENAYRSILNVISGQE